MIDHTASGFADLLRRLGRLTGNPSEVPVGIERPDGRLVDALLEAGFPVVSVSPNAIQTWRAPVHPPAGPADRSTGTNGQLLHEPANAARHQAEGRTLIIHTQWATPETTAAARGARMTSAGW